MKPFNVIGGAKQNHDDRNEMWNNCQKKMQTTARKADASADAPLNIV